MVLTVVRHGKTDYNLEDRIQGRLNIPLNDTGRRQCKLERPIIRKRDYDICFASPLFRTFETAMILVGEDTVILPDERLIDRYMGEYQGDYIYNYDSSKYMDYNLNSTDKGVEGIQEIFKRMEDFLEYLKENYVDKNILVVTHKVNIKALYHLIHHTDLSSNNLNFEVKNCSSMTFEIK